MAAADQDVGAGAALDAVMTGAGAARMSASASPLPAGTLANRQVNPSGGPYNRRRRF
jgi:hypothetical protein